MGLGALFVVYGLGGLLPAVAVTSAVTAAVRHRVRSRVAAFAVAPGAALREGFALLRGHVLDREDDTGPAAFLDVPAELPTSYRTPGARAEARPFLLKLVSGATVHVQPEEGRWMLDSTFLSVFLENDPRYVAAIYAGDEVFVAGHVQREIDARASGKGYRDVAHAWVVRAPARGELLFSSAPVIAQHARRTGFYAAWAIGLLALLVCAHVLVFAHVHERLGVLGVEATSVDGTDFLVALLLAGAVWLYRYAELETAPWVERKATLPS